jgi:hypothetical protein
MADMDINEALHLVENIPYIPWIELCPNEIKAIKIICKYVEETLESKNE